MSSSAMKPPRCEYFLPHKRRQCHMQRKANEKYCSEHLVNVKNTEGRKRVPCPLNPRHTVWEDQVKRHLKKCRARQIDIDEVWKRVDINVVGKCELLEDQIDQQEEIPKWIEPLQKLYDDVVAKEGELERKVLDHPGLESRLAELENQKHAIQQASLIGHMEQCGDMLENPDKTVIAEFGCGRGELSRYIFRAQTLKEMNLVHRYLLLDRASCRMKLDSKLLKDYEEMKQSSNDAEAEQSGGVRVKRIKGDIKDVILTPEILHQLGLLDDGGTDDMNLSIVSKHLCGCATDLTLEVMKQDAVKNMFSGAVIALCCRQVCRYDMYNLDGRDWMAATAGIDQRGFEAITKMTSWAVCGRREHAAEAQHYTGLCRDERERIGQQARRVIDYGRLLTLRKMGYEHARLVEYVSPEVSLENVCLVVTK